MKNTILFSLLCSAFLFSACAHHKDVRPGADGVHKVKVSAQDGKAGSRNAIGQANHFCEKRGRQAAFLKEDQKYTGTMDESTYNNAKTASKLAKAVGGSMFVFGDKKESNAGGILGLGAQATDSALGDGYSVEMKFKCM